MHLVFKSTIKGAVILIADNIRNASQYKNLNPCFEKAFQFLTSNDHKVLDSGRYEIDGDNIFANIQTYETSLWEDSNWETHAKYIDIQYIVEGKEKIGWCDSNNLTVKENRLADSDIIYYEQEVEASSEAVLSEGEFGIFFPSDAHRPCGCHQKPSHVKKIVVKVKC
jgi:YhcH/YjgK/YiaL family protein